MSDIGVVVVTYNRLEKLKTALCFYEAQLCRPQYIIVVDNHSTDGTDEYLRNWKEQSQDIKYEVITLGENRGGSGGFYEGLKLAVKMAADWIWVADDDAFPEKECFQIFSNYLKNHAAIRIAALCSSVYTSNLIDTWHRRRLKRYCGIVLKELQISVDEYKNETFELDLFSYVGTLLKKEAVLCAGLPQKDFFIYYDDSEHSLRVRKQGKILCLPSARVMHQAGEDGGGQINWKKYYMLRNKLYSYRLHFGLFQTAILCMYYYIRNHGSPISSLMTKKAIYDAFHGKLGLDQTYRPGWSGRK